MPSILSWIDHDSEAYARSKRIMALFSERNTQDALGLGGIRDSFSDILFPGTSTIHTRLRYMLIVPWVYLYQEEKGVLSREFGRAVDAMERDLIDVLSETVSDKEWGVFGGSSGRALKRLPSEVYWGGLGSWGIKLYPGTQNQYYRDIDLIYRRRKADEKYGDGTDDSVNYGFYTWHPRLPSPPEGFPSRLDIRMRREEARFVQDRIKNEHPESLLSHLALHCKSCSVDFPWMHPELASFTEKNRSELEQARMFSLVLHGASILYNVMLAEESQRPGLLQEHRETFQEWENRIRNELNPVRSWSSDLSRLWETVCGHGYHISVRTMDFVDEWCRQVSSSRGSLSDDGAARSLVKNREMHKKGAHSKFRNSKALDQWGGASGIGRLNYRWGNVQALLKDLYDGLEN